MRLEARRPASCSKQTHETGRQLPALLHDEAAIVVLGASLKLKLSYGSRRNKIKLLGNGVCAPVMKAIAGCFQGGMTEDLLMAAECCE